MSDSENVAPAVAAPVDDNEVFDPSAMKKKKKSKKPSTAGSSDAPSKKAPAFMGGDDEDAELDFSQMKKKKSGKKAAAAVEAALAEDDEATASPRTSARKDDEDESGDGPQGEEDGDNELLDEIVEGTEDLVFTNDDEVVEEGWINSDRDYTYPELLTRVFQRVHERNPSLAGGRKKYTMVPPQVAREGSKKTVFANVADMATRMRRNFEHVTQFLYSELGTSGSVDGSQRLIIKGRFQPKQIENVVRRYIVEYVTCKTCKSPETTLRKENRLYFVQCDSCGSTRSVSAIKSGFSAQVGSRKAAKARAGT